MKRKLLKENIAYLAWFQALAAVVASLYFSEVLKYPPCILCWYQRILMYPLVLILAVGIIKRDKDMPFYVLPLSILGMIVAFYHNLLQMDILAQELAPCALGVSCTEKYINWFNIISIPLLSLAAFAVITTCMIVLLKIKSNEPRS